MDERRRRLMETGAVLGAVATLGLGHRARAGSDGDAATDADTAEVRRVPPRPDTRSPGRAGDFDFLAGEWRIQHRRRAASGGDWDRFEGEATCWSILAGAGSVEELRVPARDFSGVGLRLLDPDAQLWSDYWVNAKQGQLATPGMPGSFEQGAGLFFSEDLDARGAYLVASVWDRISPGGCRWRQLVSRDQGRTWDPNWVMDWLRR